MDLMFLIPGTAALASVDTDLLLQTFVLALAGLVLLYLIYTAVNDFFFRDIIAKLSAEDRMGWSAKMVSSTFELFAICVGVWYTFYTDLHLDVINGTHWFTLYLLVLEGAYLCYDTGIESIKGMRAVTAGGRFLGHGRLATFFHHFIIMGVCYLRIIIHRGDFFVGLFCLMALTTPFVHARWYLRLLSKEGSTVYMVNGICMIASQFLVRIVLFPWYGAGLYALKLGLPWYRFPTLIPIKCLCFSSMFTLLNLYWLWKMVAVAARWLYGGERHSTSLKKKKTL